MMKRVILLVLLVLIITPFHAFAQEEEDDDIQIALYGVNEDGTLELIEGEEDDAHLFLWETITLLLPADYVQQYIFEFIVFESEDLYAYVSEIEEDVWQFAMNAEADPETILTIIHEFAHIVAFNNEQYVTHPSSIADGLGEFETDEAYEEALAADMAACSTIAFEDGCLLEGSFLLDFTQAFWTEEEVELTESGEVDGTVEYYEARPDDYVTFYAASNPGEDFAETFSYFVALDEAPLGETLAEEKILWFYDNPDMMALRDEIRANAEANNLELVILEAE